MNQPRITFGDRVRFRSTGFTEAMGLAGKTGIVFGETTPSATGILVLGNPSEDYGVTVGLDGQQEEGEQLWFATELLEFIDHGPGQQIRVGPHSYIRDEEGNWHQLDSE